MRVGGCAVGVKEMLTPLSVCVCMEDAVACDGVPNDVLVRWSATRALQIQYTLTSWKVADGKCRTICAVLAFRAHDATFSNETGCSVLIFTPKSVYRLTQCAIRARFESASTMRNEVYGISTATEDSMGKAVRATCGADRR